MAAKLCLDFVLRQELLNNYGKYMYLKLFVDSDDKELIEKYRTSINERNVKMANNLSHIDAGFDLFSPATQQMSNKSVQKLDCQVICSAEIIESDKSYNTGFYMYPRSSISKSNIRLANNVGIIDAGYRGHLMGMFDVIYEEETTINKFDRFLQICAPNLIPIFVELVNSREELGVETTRGNGGFGSTGK